MTDAALMLKAVRAVGPALLITIVLWAASIRWSKFAPFVLPLALAVGFLPVLLIEHGAGTQRWRWVTVGVSLFALAGGLAVTRRHTAALLRAALGMLGGSVFVGLTHIDHDPPWRLMVLLLGPLLACTVPMAAERPGRLDALAMFVASAAVTPCILFAGHDALVEVYAAIPTVLGVGLVLVLWRPTYAAGLLVAAPILASFALVAWNAAYEPPRWVVWSLALTGGASLPLAITTGKHSWLMPSLLTISLAVAGLVIALINVDLTPY